MNLIKSTLVLSFAILSGILSVESVYADTIKYKDYFVAGSVGDKWTYVKLSSTSFTWTLSQIDVGVNAGHMKLGDANSGIIYDVNGDVVTWYELVGEAVFNPPVTFAATYETDQEVAVYDTEAIFIILPTLNVQAGTYNDVLLTIWLDNNYPPNTMNTSLGIESLTASAVTDLDYLAKGVGIIKHTGVSASTGASDGNGYELTQYEPVNTSGKITTDSGSGSGALGLPILFVFFIPALSRKFYFA